MRHRTITVVIIVLSAFSIARAQQLLDKTTTLRNVVYNGVDVAQVLIAFAQDYDVTIGLETDPDKPHSPITLHLRNVVFKDILDGIVQAEPLYRWRENNGCIDFLPVSGGLNLFDERIDNLKLKDVNRELALNRLFGLPEIQALLSSRNLRPRPPYPVPAQIKDEKLSFDLRGVTLRQALNQIANDSGAKFWVFRSYPDGTFEVRFRAY